MSFLTSTKFNGNVATKIKYNRVKKKYEFKRHITKCNEIIKNKFIAY